MGKLTVRAVEEIGLEGASWLEPSSAGAEFWRAEWLRARCSFALRELSAEM